MSTDGGTVDITNLVESLRSSFVLACKDYLMGLALAVPGIGTIALWFLKVFAGAALDWVLDKISKWEVMQAFFLNTAIKKASQAADYQKAVKTKNNLPVDVSDDDYLKAEKHEISMFTDLVRLNN